MQFRIQDVLHKALFTESFQMPTTKLKITIFHFSNFWERKTIFYVYDVYDSQEIIFSKLFLNRPGVEWHGQLWPMVCFGQWSYVDISDYTMEACNDDKISGMKSQTYGKVFVFKIDNQCILFHCQERLLHLKTCSNCPFDPLFNKLFHIDRHAAEEQRLQTSSDILRFRSIIGKSASFTSIFCSVSDCFVRYPRSREL